MFMDEKTPRRYWQFRLRTLLWLMLCIVIGFGAYRQGFERGADVRLSQRQEVGQTTTVVYNVSDVLPMTRTKTGVIVDFDGLIRDMEKNVLPRTWNSSGGEASLAEFAATLSLVVNHDKDGHARVADYLDGLRKKKKEEEIAAK